MHNNNDYDTIRCKLTSVRALPEDCPLMSRNVSEERELCT